MIYVFKNKFNDKDYVAFKSLNLEVAYNEVSKIVHGSDFKLFSIHKGIRLINFKFSKLI